MFLLQKYHKKNHFNTIFLIYNVKSNIIPNIIKNKILICLTFFHHFLKQNYNGSVIVVLFNKFKS